MAVNLEEVQYRLKQFGSPLPYKDGFHLGMRDNPNAVELEIGMGLMGAMIDTRPRTVVELGTGPGYSTAWLLVGLEKINQGHLWTVDVVQADSPLWRQVGLGDERVTYHGNETVESAIQHDLLPKRIDFLFHDASHHAEHVLADVHALLARIPTGGTIAVHDVNYRRDMGDQLRDWFDARPEEWRYEEISMGCGLGIARRLSGGYVEQPDQAAVVGRNAKEPRAKAKGNRRAPKRGKKRVKRVAARRKVRADDSRSTPAAD